MEDDARQKQNKKAEIKFPLPAINNLTSASELFFRLGYNMYNITESHIAARWTVKLNFD